MLFPRSSFQKRVPGEKLVAPTSQAEVETWIKAQACALGDNEMDKIYDFAVVRGGPGGYTGRTLCRQSRAEEGWVLEKMSRRFDGHTHNR